MSNLVIDDELITSHGALSIFHAAIDELSRRYGGSDEEFLLQFDELMPPRGFFLVARVDGHPVGGVGVRTIGDEALLLGEVKRLWVRPDQRRLGLAAQLMSALEDRARRRGFSQLYLETGHAQPEALALYPTIGWRPVDAFPDGAFSYPEAFRFTKVL